MALTNFEKIDHEITLGTQGDWFHARLRVRINTKLQKKWFALKVRVSEEGSRTKAIRVATTKLNELKDRSEKGLPLKKVSFQKMGKRCLKEWRAKALYNEELSKQGNYDLENYETIEHGKTLANKSKSVWRMNTYSQYRKGIKDFSDFLDSEYSSVAINEIDDQIFDKFILWCNKNRPSRQWSTIQKYVTGIRKVFLHAVDLGELPTKNMIPQLSFEGAKTTKPIQTPNISFEDVKNLLDYTHKKAKQRKEEGYEDWGLYYQFHLHLGLLATSGIRPPSKRKNVIRDEHISFVRGGIFLARMNMKGHDYTSLCLPDFKNYYDKAIDLKKRFKVKSEFLLPHLLDKGMCKKGEPILSWRKQWTSALQELQIPKMTLYALRHFYITGRVEDTNASPLEIAKITGTSVRMIEATYFAPNIEDNYSKLTQTSQKFDIEDL